MAPFVRTPIPARRGYTLVELMVVVAIVGIMAALGTQGMRRYLSAAKSAEALNMVGAISRGAITAFERDQASNEILGAGQVSAHDGRALCGSALPVPASIASVSGRKYQPNSATGQDYQTAAWACVMFSNSNPQSYQAGYTSSDGFVEPDDSPAKGSKDDHDDGKKSGGKDDHDDGKKSGGDDDHDDGKKSGGDDDHDDGDKGGGKDDHDDGGKDDHDDGGKDDHDDGGKDDHDDGGGDDGGGDKGGGDKGGGGDDDGGGDSGGGDDGGGDDGGGDDGGADTGGDSPPNALNDSWRVDARGDTDGDGRQSWFTLLGTVSNGKIRRATAIATVDEYE